MEERLRPPAARRITMTMTAHAPRAPSVSETIDALARVREAIARAPFGPPLSEEERAGLADARRLPASAWLTDDEFRARLSQIRPDAEHAMDAEEE
jgi:hypothetical protein